MQTHSKLAGFLLPMVTSTNVHLPVTLFPCASKRSLHVPLSSHLSVKGGLLLHIFTHSAMTASLFGTIALSIQQLGKVLNSGAFLCRAPSFLCGIAHLHKKRRTHQPLSFCALF